MNYVRKDLYKKKFDGRQIRNIVTSAMGVALADNRQMTMEDLNNVVTIMMGFKGDLEYQMRQYEGELSWPQPIRSYRVCPDQVR